VSAPAVNLRDYALVTLSYWAFTLSDGALRMLVLLHFHQLGFTPVQLAFLFLFYEFFGIVTNLLGGWIGSRVGLRFTLYAGLGIQVFALLMLSAVDVAWGLAISVAYVMVSQAFSGIAKDLTKMSSKSAVKLLVPPDEDGGGSRLFHWVAVLTGSKNALKGLGFLLGGLFLWSIGFVESLWIMAGVLALVLVVSMLLLKQELGKSKKKVKFNQLFSKSREINMLSIARFFLFGSRDVWFVVGLPVFLMSSMGWNAFQIGAFTGCWIIFYGIVQAAAPGVIRRSQGEIDEARAAPAWGFVLAALTAAIAAAIQFDFHPTVAILGGLALFAVIFAVNSSVHSYLILAYTDSDQVAVNVGFYYMANACGRLVGTLLSGVLFIWGGLPICLWGSALMVLAAAGLTLLLPSTRMSPAARPV